MVAMAKQPQPNLNPTSFNLAAVVVLRRSRSGEEPTGDLKHDNKRMLRVAFAHIIIQSGPCPMCLLWDSCTARNAGFQCLSVSLEGESRTSSYAS